MATRKVKCLMTSVLAFLCFLFSTSKSQDYDHCGLRSASTRSRIIGGIQSRHGMWPWQVAIYKGSDDGMKQKQFICGGALLNMKWVITTAHCFYKISETSSRIRYVEDSSTPNKYHVVAGDYNIFRKENTEQVRQALNIRVFPGYRHAPHYENDIALIELNETVTLGPFVRTICIPDSNEKVSVPGKVASIAGWGRTTKSIRSPVLLHSAYQIQNDDLCDQATAYFFNRSVTFCAGSGKGGNDTCQGDSGSSLVRQVFHKGAQRWVTVGLVSWGEGCGLKGKYGYYTRMEPFVPWIQKTIKVNCGRPSNIRNGRYTGKDFSEGSRVKYKCKRGYKLKGRPRRKCRPNWEWSKAPVCRKAQCPRLSNPRNGSRRPAKRTYFYRDRVRFSCKTNFTRIGKPFIICKHDATWSGSQAFCLAPCPDPGIPKGGSRLDHSFRHNNLVRFSCNRGRKMEGARTIRCNRGRWNQSPPKCLGQAAMCARPRTPANGNIGTRKSLYNNKDRLRFFCKLGYKLDGDEYAVCVNGKWNKDPPTCERICSYPGSIANGYFSGSEFIEGREVRFYCRGGFDLIGSQTIRCLSTGRWNSGQRPECKRRCNNPVIPSNGPKSKPSLVRGYQTKHGTAIKFGCRPRYTLEGRQTIHCDDGRWSGNIPSCKGGCEVPNNFTGVHSSPRVLPGQNVPHSSRIRFSCLNNKTLNGSKESVCDDRNWSALFPKCEVFETDCQDPGVPQNGYVTSLPTVDFPQGTTIIFACNNTYTPQGHQIIECQSGKWSHNIPKCLAPCEDPGVPQDGIRYDSAFQHDDRVRFACKSGKIMKGEAVIRCNDGKWNHEPPKCRGAIKTLCHTFFVWSDIFCEIK